MKSMLFLFSVLLALSIAFESAVAGDAPLHLDDEQTAIESMLRIMDDETAIATKTKMNADYVPGMVTVLHGDELEMLGIDVVWKALQLVPGIHLRISGNGDPQVVTRGIGGLQSSPELKFLIDGMPAHNALLGFGAVLYIPVSEVDRIEVIRGPGSALYGEYAFAGVIDVVTRKEKSRVTAQYGSYNTHQESAVAAYNSIENDLRFSASAVHYRTDGANPLAGPDRIGRTGLSNEFTQENMVVLSAGYKDTSLYARFNGTKGGNYFGLLNILEPAGKQGSFSSDDLLIGLDQKLNFSSNTALILHADYSRYKVNALYTVSPPANQTEIFYKERKYSTSAQLMTTAMNSHQWLFGVDYSDAKPTEIWWRLNFAFVAPSTYIPLGGFTAPLVGSSNWVKEGKSRKTAGFFVQDQFEVSDQLTLTAGVRHDRFNDVGSSTSPRIAAVYKPAEHHILKAQFSQAYRPPTLNELYENTGAGNINLKAETISSIEGGYIYSTHDAVGRVTLFYSRIKNLITKDGINPYQNMLGTVALKGVELELEKRLGESIRLDANISYVKTKDPTSGTELEGASNLSANVVATWQPVHDYALSFWGRYVGARHRAAADTRAKLGSDTTLDISLTANDFIQSDLVLRAGVKNLFNRVVKYPAVSNTFANDYPRESRQWWTQASYEF